MRWERIDLSARTALVVETKNGDDRVLSLTEPVVAELRRFHEDDGLVFPSPWISDQAYTFRPVWLKALADAGLSGPAGVRLRFHEL